MASRQAHRAPRKNIEETDRSWKQEDPNLLNIPALLYKEAESLPLPVRAPENVAAEKEFQQTVKIMRQLIIENNVVLESVKRKSEFAGSKEAAYKVVENMIVAFEALNREVTAAISTCQTKPKWEDDVKSKTFSNRNREKIQRWKASLEEFLGSYLKIREFIPKETLDANGSGGSREVEQEQFRLLPTLLAEFDNLLKVIEVMMEN